MSAYAALPRRHKRFVDAYVECWQGAEAMRRAGFKGKEPRMAACQLKARPEIEAAIAERAAEVANRSGLTAGQVLRDVEEIKQRCMQQVSPVLNRKGEQVYVEDREGNLVAAYTFDSANAMRALEFQGKVLKMLVNVHEHAGADGAPLIPLSFGVTFPQGFPGVAAPKTEDDAAGEPPPSD